MNDITAHFKGNERREEEGEVRRKGARRRSKMRPLKQKVELRDGNEPLEDTKRRFGVKR